MPKKIHLMRIRAAGLRAARVLSAIILVGVVLALAVNGGCAEKKKGEAAEKKQGSSAVSDTSAYRSAIALADTTARIQALETFLQDYPSSPFRPGVYSRLYDLKVRRDPAQAAAFLTDHLKTEKDPGSRGRLYYSQYLYAKAHAPDQVAPTIEALRQDQTPDADAYNMVAWDLVEEGQRLDDAVSLASIGVEKAADSLSKGSVLDTKGWAQFGKGNFGEAAKTLEQAVGYSPSEDVQAHLAQAYDKAGEAAKARDLYAELLIAREDPQMRARVEALTEKLHGSPRDVFRVIDQKREAAARPAADFALKDYDGKELRLADLKGKVVLLDFWHPT